MILFHSFPFFINLFFLSRVVEFDVFDFFIRTRFAEINWIIIIIIIIIKELFGS